MAYLVVDLWKFVFTQLFEILINILIRQIAAKEYTMNRAVLACKLFQSAGSLASGEKLVQPCTGKREP